MSTLPVVMNGIRNAPAVVQQAQGEVGSNARRGNTSRGGWIVQKFGGTSVGKFAVNIAEDIVRYACPMPGTATIGGVHSRAKKQIVGKAQEWRLMRGASAYYRASLNDNKIAVVCSARSTGKKVEGTTSRCVFMS